jgi:hypothetical protein
MGISNCLIHGYCFLYKHQKVKIIISMNPIIYLTTILSIASATFIMEAGDGEFKYPRQIE